ncbi:MAG TPA: hypothetical protein VGD61_15375 [Pyrinomonadaceae bacterium]
MATATTALAATSATDPEIAVNVGVILNSQLRVDEIQKKLSEDFRREVLVIAKDVATATPATFNIETFTANWTQQLERFKGRSSALASFETELARVIESYKQENAPELIKALEAGRALLEEQLRQRNEVDDSIESEIRAIDKVIVELKKYLRGGRVTPVVTATAQASITTTDNRSEPSKRRQGKSKAGKK